MRFERASLSVVTLPSTFYPFSQDGFIRWVAQTMKAPRPAFERLFLQYAEAYRIAEETATEVRSRLASVGDGVRYEGDIAEHLRFVEQLGFDVNIAAETLLLRLDAILSGLRFQLFKSDTCRDDGPELRNGVTVDRALDAIGNYVRHDFEWFSHDYKDTLPTEHQERSIKPLAQLWTGRPIETAEDAYKTFTTIPLVSASVLDLLGNYETDGPKMTYQTVESKVYAAALESIGRRFAAPADALGR